MNLLKAVRRTTPEDKAEQHLYQARMELLDAQMALDHYNALVVSLQASVQRLEKHLGVGNHGIIKMRDDDLARAIAKSSGNS